jgi:hypothetical protein
MFLIKLNLNHQLNSKNIFEIILLKIKLGKLYLTVNGIVLNIVWNNVINLQHFGEILNLDLQKGIHTD